MRRFGVIFTVTAVIFMTACTVATQTKSHVSAVSDTYLLCDTTPNVYEGILKAPYLYTEGLKSIRLYGDTAKAMDFFTAAIETDSNYAPAWYEAAATIAPKDRARALQYSQSANNIDSTNQWYRSQLARLYLMNNDTERAQRIYEEQIKINPRNPDNYSMLAMIYQVNRQPYRAIMLLDTAENYLGRNAALSGYKFELLMSVKLYDRAIAESEALIKDYPYDYQNYLMLAEVYAATGKDSLAIHYLDAARTLNPSGVDVLATMNDYYKSKGDIPNFFATAEQLFMNDLVGKELKVRFFNEITADRNFYRDNFNRIDALATILIMKYPKDKDIRDIYTQNMIAGGNLEGALNLYKRILNDSMPDIGVFNTILDMEAYLNRSDSVAKYAALAQQYYPEDPSFYIQHGSAIAFYMQSRDEAISLYKKALKYADNDSMRSAIYCLIGDCYQYEENPKKSYQNYRKAITLWPDNVMALNNFAYNLSEQGKELENALAMSARVLELEPGNATYIDTYGWILFKLGRYDEAKKYMQQAISLDPRGSDEIFLHYGDILHATGDDYMATIYWRKAAEAGYDQEKIDQRLKKLQNQ